MIVYLLQGMTLGLSAAASPGPFQAYLLAQTSKNGWQRTLPAALAPLLSDGPIIALTLLVLTQTPDWFLRALRIVGGFFILYLAQKAYTTFKTTSPTLQPVEAAGQSLLEATLMNALNPNPYIFWSIIVGPILLEGWQQSASLGVSFVVGFYGTLVGGFAGFIILFGVAQRLVPRINRALSGLSALALVIFGFYQLWLGITAR